jgi:hypothetical protein
MGKHRDLETRLAQAEQMVERNTQSADRHAKAAKRFSDRREYEKATNACRLHDRAEGLKRKWQREVRRLTRMVQTRNALQARAPQVEREQRLTRSAKQRRAQEKADRAARTRAQDRRKRMAAAGVDHYDDRTAHGSRHYDVVSLGPSLRISLNHFNSCVRKRSERTDARVLAWSKFERHCHRVNAGLLPAPRFEPGIDSSPAPGVSDSRLDALRADAGLRAWLGHDMHGLLVSVIYEGRSFRDLEEVSCLDEKIIAAMFLRALDLAAVHFKVGEDNSFGREVNRVFAKVEAQA